MKTSLLIATYNWPEALELVLRCVLRQNRMPDEILIADDGSDDTTRAVIDTARDSTTVPIHHHWHEDQSYRKTTIVNRALAAATGDYIVQIDGDVLVHPAFVGDHCAFAAPKHFIRGYRIHLNEPQTARILSEKVFAFGPFAAGAGMAFKSLRMPMLSRVFRRDALDCTRVYGCNLSFWREDALAVNGYNNDFIGWGIDDQEFAARLNHLGVKRRKVRFAAKQYHLYHPESSRAMESKNQELLRSTMASDIIRCRNGILQDDLS